MGYSMEIVLYALVVFTVVGIVITLFMVRYSRALTREMHALAMENISKADKEANAAIRPTEKGD